ncbi:MAG: MFS transporter [Bacteroidetes bacterium]|nr:MAG: MFS transporter [Bacteroidota bacterium]
MITASKKVINAWAMFDWANSVYNLVITATFFPIYFETVTKGPNGSDKVEFLGFSFINSSLYNYALSFAYLLIALAYPLLTSIADTRGNKKNFMRFFCTMGALGCSSLYFFKGTSNLWLGITALIFGAMGYVGSQVFYNAYLPEIAAPEDRDRVSARGFSFGYTGSVILQLIGFALVLTMANKGEATRITFLLVGIWWWGFAQITFAGLPKVPPKPKQQINVLSHGFVEIKKVWQQTRTQPVLKRFLRGFFFYSMGVQAIMLAATMFGSKTLGLPQANLIATIVIIQLLAVVGAVSMSKLSTRFGNLKVLMGVLIMWLVCCAVAIYAAEYKQQGGNPERLFYGIAVGVGLVMGGVQSLSRSTFSKLMPATNSTASYFSYYDFNEKLAIVIGIFSFGFIHEATGSMQNSILCLMVFFAIGFAWLYAALKKQRSLTTEVVA